MYFLVLIFVLVALFVHTDTVSIAKLAEVSCLGQQNTQRGADVFKVESLRYFGYVLVQGLVTISRWTVADLHSYGHFWACLQVVCFHIACVLNHVHLGLTLM